MKALKVLILIRVIDLTKEFNNDPDPKRFFPGRRFNHYNKAGYRLVVNTIDKELR